MTNPDASPHRLGESAASLQLVDVRKVFERDRGGTVVALDGVSLQIGSGAFVAVMGPSGCGKSTLLHCSAGLSEVTAGRVFVDGTPMSAGSESVRTRFRRERISVVFQHLNLLPSLTVLQNVMLPSQLARRPVGVDRACDHLARVGIEDRVHDLPGSLSGGQQKRAAIARALASGGSMIFADEPTGQLDTHTAAQVLSLLRDVVAVDGSTVMMVTHDPVAAAYADTVVLMADGRLVDELTAPTPTAVATRLAEIGRPASTVTTQRE